MRFDHFHLSAVENPIFITQEDMFGNFNDEGQGGCGKERPKQVGRVVGDGDF